MTWSRAGGRFATTQWSLVIAAGRRESPDADEALEELCSRYWHPIFAFARRRGHSKEDAQDLTQGFFARLIEKGDLSAADRSRGRFRTFLLTNFQYFLSNERDRQSARKRGGGTSAVSIDLAAAEERYELALSHDETPERLFDRQWCLTLLGEVLKAVRLEYLAAGREDVFDRLKEYLMGEAVKGTYAEAARDLGMTPPTVKVNVHRLRKTFRAALRQHVADTVASPADVEDEIQYLLRTLAIT